MKKVNLFYLMIFLLVVPAFIYAQEGEEKEIKVKLVKVVDGKTTTFDTVFTSKGDMEQDIRLLIDKVADVDSAQSKTISIELSANGSDSTGRPYKVMVFTGDDDISMIAPPAFNHKVKHWVDKDGRNMEFEFNLDKENMEGLRVDIERQVEEAMRQHEDVEREMELMNGERMKWVSMPPRPPKPPRPMHPEYPGNRYFFHGGFDDGGVASQEELRDAGIKSQPDQLVLTTLDIDNRGGVITLRFMPKEDNHSTKVTVYNYFGDKVYTGKPEMVGDVYQLTIDLSAKQPGTYFIQMVQKNASVTQRVEL
ncbi:MAG: T9SS type A sorting domain-containing protein [Bacteroidetes bacterium]|nr:T9SS type A sorting domain-containing protein [Bacteroidota bacterium]